MEEALIKRIPPHSEEAEKAVVGAMLMGREAVETALGILTKEDFYEQRFGVLFAAMRELHDEEVPIDVVTLVDRLRKKEVPPEVADIPFLSQIISSVPLSGNVGTYARIVSDKAAMRRLIKAAADIENDCYQGREEVADLMEKAEKTMFAVLQQKQTEDFTPVREVVLDVLLRIEEASKARTNVTGLSTGFIDLDYKTSGLQRSDFILIAARPSMGKTAFALNILQYICFHEGEAGVIFSLEMSKDQLMNRLLSLVSHVDSQKIRTGQQLLDDDWLRLVEAAGVISNSSLIIDDTPGLTLQQFRSKCRKYKLDHDIKIIFVDYLQLMAGNGGRSDNRQQEISDISRAMKSLARELNVPVVALSQLNRGVEQREDHRPMLSDLRESGAIEQDADVVMFIYRDDYYNKDTSEKGIAEIIIAKQRNGPIGTVKLVWLSDLTKFANMRKNAGRNVDGEKEKD